VARDVILSACATVVEFFAGWDLASNFYPGYYSDYDYQDGIEEAPPPAVSEAAVTPPPATPSKPPEALVMELRGDQWVRLTSFAPMEIGGQSNEAQAGQSSSPTQTKRPLLPFERKRPANYQRQCSYFATDIAKK